MTSQELADMNYPLGMPRAWLFNHENQPLVDIVGRPIARYITDFEYAYREEEDDTCTIEFQFDDIVHFSLPFFDNDIVLVVQWGFVMPSGEVIKSPKRKVAVRDISSDYSSKGIRLTLECSDLVAYLKGYKTGTIRNYQNPDAHDVINTVGSRVNHWLDWLKEIAAGEYIPTVTINKKTVRIDELGGTTIADYDPIENRRHNIVRDVTAIPRIFVQEFHAAKTIKGKHKAIDNIIDELTKDADPSKGSQGPFYVDGTDNILEIKQRNYDQKIFKTFTWNGGKRNFVSFNGSTDTRKVEEDKAKSAGVNPYSKETDSTEVNFLDTEEKETLSEDYHGNIISIDPEQEGIIARREREYRENYKEGLSKPKTEPKPVPNIDSEKLKNLDGKTIVEGTIITNDISEVTTERAKEWLEGTKDLFIDNYRDNVNNQSMPENLTYLKTTKRFDKSQGFYDRTMPEVGLKRMSIEASTVINNPDFQPLLEETANELKKKAIRSQGLINHAIEKIQRKHEASATVLGDPSLIKARTYGFLGLSPKDTGKWYCTGVSHKINVGNGYMCDMSLVRKPKTIGVHEINYRGKRNLLEQDEKIELNQYITSKYQSLYAGLEDEVYEEMANEEDPSAMEDRVEVLNAESDFTPDEI